MKVYSNGCPRCKVVKTILTAKGINYEEVSDFVEIKRVAQEMGTQELPLIVDKDNERYSGSGAVAYVRGLE